MHPLIGIAPSFSERGRFHDDRDSHHIDAAYARAVESAGAACVYLPMQAKSVELLSHLDGLVIPGGPDLAPERAYPAEVKFDVAPPQQLEFDLCLVREALARDLPFLGICYGMQLLAVHFRGALHYDIESDVPGAAPHRLPEPDGRQGLRIEPGTRLHALLGAEPGPVNSRHHQAVATPGPGLRACAHAEDGLIEAIESPAARFCIGVQWHPEGLDGPHRDGLFGGLVAACAG